MDNISDIHNCFGCGVCASSCKKNVIDIRLNDDGFYEPFIQNADQCTHCGICRSVCSFINPLAKNDSVKPLAYAGWSNDSSIRSQATSGGVIFELAKQLLSYGYKICGVRYNVFHARAEHYIASNIEELSESIGSKYIQSFTLDALREINLKEKYLFIGTPCQVSSFRRMIRKLRCEENFILVDFFCHGVPSMLAWKKYSQRAKQHVGNIQTVRWRSKENGWRNSYVMSIIGDKGKIYSSRSRGDMFLNMFLSDCCLGPQCYSDCKFKYLNSSADIRVGDFWGSEYKDNKIGVNSVLAFTLKGQELLKRINCTFIPHSLEVVTDGQLRNNATRASFTDKVMKSLRTPNETIQDAARYALRLRSIRIWKGRLNHLMSILHIKYRFL